MVVEGPVIALAGRPGFGEGALGTVGVRVKEDWELEWEPLEAMELTRGDEVPEE